MRVLIVGTRGLIKGGVSTGMNTLFDDAPVEGDCGTGDN